MSRIGKQPIPVPAGVTVTVGDAIVVKGPKGTLTQANIKDVSVALEDGQVIVSRANEGKPARSAHGLLRSLVSNMVQGVSTGFEKKLQIVGIGYRAEVKGSTLVLNLGYSHPVEFPIPAGIAIEADKAGNLTIRGADRQQVGQVAAVIRAYRAPDHYKGKGVRYANEHVRIKTGKSA